MKREEHKQHMETLLGMVAPEHQAKASEILTTLTDDYETTLTGAETTLGELEKLKENNETLRKVNADLFLKVGHTPQSTSEPKPSEPPKDDVKTYDSLFDEKGELK